MSLKEKATQHWVSYFQIAVFWTILVYA